jgi:hypothetical protein
MSHAGTQPKRATSAGRSTRSAVPQSPFRDVFAPGPLAPSRDRRLQVMSKDFDKRVTLPYNKRVDEILAATDKQRYLSAEDRAVLASVRERNGRFAGNVEAVLEDAVRNNDAMSRSLVQRCHRQHTLCRGNNGRIDETLRRIDAQADAATSSPPRKSMLLSAKAKPRPTSFEDVATPRRFARSPARRSGSPAATSRDADEAVLRRLERKRQLTADDARAAQQIFVRRHGEAHGKAAFTQWLAQLPLPLLRVLHSQMPHLAAE